MTQYGSLQNTLYNQTRSAVPEVGMGATEIGWTDRHAYTVIAVSPSGKTITIQQDRAERVDDHGMCDCQEYRFERDTAGKTYKVTLRQDGRWKVAGTSHMSVLVGVRQEHYDYSF